MAAVMPADVHCWAFSPLCGVSPNLGAAMAPFCTSVLVGKDLISRAGIASLARLLEEMLIALARCRHPALKACHEPRSPGISAACRL